MTSSLESIAAEVKLIRRQSTKSVIKKPIVGGFVILSAGVCAYLLLFLKMVIM